MDSTTLGANEALDQAETGNTVAVDEVQCSIHDNEDRREVSCLLILKQNNLSRGSSMISALCRSVGDVVTFTRI
mgnify:CR=1 FL=1